MEGVRVEMKTSGIGMFMNETCKRETSTRNVVVITLLNVHTPTNGFFIALFINSLTAQLNYS